LFFKKDDRSLKPWLLTPIRPILILSPGETAFPAFDIASAGIKVPAASTDAVFIKFLRVEFMTVNFL
jgi:hypothetical protein